MDREVLASALHLSTSATQLEDGSFAQIDMAADHKAEQTAAPESLAAAIAATWHPCRQEEASPVAARRGAARTARAALDVARMANLREAAAVWACSEAARSAGERRLEAQLLRIEVTLVGAAPPPPPVQEAGLLGATVSESCCGGPSGGGDEEAHEEGRWEARLEAAEARLRERAASGLARLAAQRQRLEVWQQAHSSPPPPGALVAGEGGGPRGAALGSEAAAAAALLTCKASQSLACLSSSPARRCSSLGQQQHRAAACERASRRREVQTQRVLQWAGRKTAG